MTPFVHTSRAVSYTHLAAEKAIQLANTKEKGEHPHVFTGSVEHAIAHIEESIAARVDTGTLRWYAIKLFERDSKIAEDVYKRQVPTVPMET